MSHGKKGTKFNAKTVLRMTAAVARIHEIDQQQYQRTVNRTLRLVVSQERNAAKRIADIAGTTLHAAKNWLADRCTPGAFHLARLRSAMPELDAELRRLEVMEAENNPAFQRELTALVFKHMAKQHTALTAEHDRIRDRKDG